MHELSVHKSFKAYHFLIGGEWGYENHTHFHQYKMSLSFKGAGLDRHNYLLDITQINDFINTQIERYSGKLLNDLPEFKDQNPSIELFSKIIYHNLLEYMSVAPFTSVKVTIWEDDEASTTYAES